MDFDAVILAVIVQSATLFASDDLLGAGDTMYPQPPPAFLILRRGLDLNDAMVEDSLTLSISTTTVQFEFFAGNVMDQVRVLTSSATVPEPSTLTLLLVAAGPLAWSARSRRRRRVQANKLLQG